MCFNTEMYKKLNSSPSLFGLCDKALLEVKKFCSAHSVRGIDRLSAKILPEIILNTSVGITGERI